MTPRRLLQHFPGDATQHLDRPSLRGLRRLRGDMPVPVVILGGYAPGLDTWRPVPACALTTQLRLAAVYAFAPAPNVGRRLLAEPWGRTAHPKERR